jgi:hypothetical protein
MPNRCRRLAAALTYAALASPSTCTPPRQATSGVADQNSGGTVIYLSQGLRLSYDKWSTYVSFGIPVLKEPNGIQSQPSWRLITGTSFAL